MKPKTLLILLVVVAAVYLLTLYKRGEGLIKEGNPAPNFTLPVRNGKIVHLSDFRGKTVLLNFWATWCPPCVQEIASLEELKRKMEGRGFQLLAVSLDEEGWTAVERFTGRHPLTMTVLLDARGDVATTYGTYRLPESYLIDKRGVVVRKYIGPRNWTDNGIVSEIMKYVEGP